MSTPNKAQKSPRKARPLRAAQSPFTVLLPVMHSIYDIAPLSLDRIRTYALRKRKSKVTVRDFGKPLARGASVRDLLDSLPRILAAEDLRVVVAAIRRARAKGKPVLWGIGGHVIKVGLAPVLIDLMRRGFVNGIAMNGAAMVHDFEIALVGNTSEDVDAVLGRGEFGLEIVLAIAYQVYVLGLVRVVSKPTALTLLSMGAVCLYAARLRRRSRV